MVQTALKLLNEHFLHPWFLTLGGLLVLSLLLAARHWFRAQRLANQFAGSHVAADVESQGFVLKQIPWLLGMVAVIVGAAGPLYGRNPATQPVTGRDLWIVLDVSRSMLAEEPYDRTTRAQRWLREAVQALHDQASVRMGIIVFAGKAKVLCPLTEDKNHLLASLQLSHPRQFNEKLRLERLPDGTAIGTNLNAGLALAADVADAKLRGYQDVLVVSDGDDLAANWQSAVHRLVEAGVTVSTLVVGTPELAAPIPTGRAEQPYEIDVDGSTRITSLRNDALLQAMSTAGAGRFWREEDAGTPATFVASVAAQPRFAWDGDVRLLRTHQYAWFYGAALGFWWLAWIMTEFRRGGSRLAERI